MALWSRFRNLLRSQRHSSDLDDELAFHVDMRTRENIAAGMPPEEALREAQLRFGNVLLQKERTRDAAILPDADALLQDVRYAVRALRTSRGVAALIVLALALGIGANTAIFTLSNALMLRPLPVHDPAGLVNVRVGNFISFGYIEVEDSFSYRLWEDFTRRQEVLSEVFAYADTRLDATLGGEQKEIIAAFVTERAFPALGIRPAAGRTFRDEEQKPGPDATVAVIGYGLWQREFLSDPSVLGRSILVEGKPFTIIGVAPPRFLGLHVGRSVDVYLPLAAEPYIRGVDSALPQPSHYFLQAFGRLRPGIGLQQAGARVAAFSRASMEATVPVDLPEAMRAEYKKQRYLIVPASLGLSDARDTLSRPLAVLTALAGLLLLLTCVTIASLLLARSTARQREIAVRIALGAPRLRIARQLLIESLILALIGAAAGIFLARGGTWMLVQAYSTSDNPLSLDLSPDAAVLGFTAAVAVFSAILFGFAPALRASQLTPAASLRGGSATMPKSILRLRRLLLAGQVALAIVLVTGAVLFGETLRNLVTTETGFRSDRVLLVSVDLRRAKIPEKSRLRLYTDLLDALERLPAVQSASASYITPISGWAWQFDVRAEKTAGLERVHVFYNAISPDYCRTFGSSLLSGRNVNANDRAGAPLAGVVNVTLARQVFGTESPLGRRLRIGEGPAERAIEIVGVVQDVKYRDLRQPVPPTLYGPLAQEPDVPPFVSYALRTAIPLAAIEGDVRRTLAKANPDLSFKLIPFSLQISNSIARERVIAILCTSFGALSLVLALIGLYGVLSYFIAQRQAEIGIRLALGATPAAVRRLIYAQSFVTCLAGVAAGLLLAVWAARFTGAMLYGLTPADPRVYVLAVAILGGAAAVATAIPAFRASRTDPMRVLRCE